MTSGMLFFTWLSDHSGLSHGGIARRLGISASLVSRIIKGERNFTLGLLQCISKEFEIPLEVVYAQAGILPARHNSNTIGNMTSHEKEFGQNGDGIKANSLREEELLRRKITEYEQQLKSLKNVKSALQYALSDQLPLKAIDKIAKIIKLEILYHETM